jgi:hypothetical protein
MRVPAILRDSALAMTLSVVPASGYSFAASSMEPDQQESFLPRDVEPDPDTGAGSTGPYDPEDLFVDPRGFPLGGWREIKSRAA